MIESAGIIAAGEGSRFRQAGITTPKPLIPVAGFPLIGHTLRRYEGAGIRRIVIIFNETEADCVAWVKAHFPRLMLQIIVKSTASSFESFWRVGQALGPGRHLLSTVDSICSDAEIRKMAVEGKDEREIRLGVTTFVHDEKPLWVQMDEATHKISALSVPSGKYATAGFYNVPGAIFNEKPEVPIASLRVFLKWLAEQGYPVSGVPLTDVVDVDTPEDLALAEKLLKV